MNTKLRAGKNVKYTDHKVVANFTNGFAQNVLELEDGTLILISYSGTEVQIIERELFDNPETQIPALVNATEEDEA